MTITASSRTVFVTGATSGIGLAVSERLIAEGHRVIGLGRDFHRTAGLAAERFVPVVLDLSDLDALPARLTALARGHGDVDALVLSAGRGLVGGLEQLSYAQIRDLIDLNFTSQAFVARAFLPALKRRGQGDVVFLGSEAALAGKRQGSLYCAAKFALRGFAQSLREECAPSGVRVTLINPGMVATPFFDQMSIAPGEAPENSLEAAEVAAAVAFALHLRPGAIVEELNLAPLTRVVRKKAVPKKPRRAQEEER